MSPLLSPLAVHETSTVRDECPPAAPISGGERRGRERGSDVCFEYRYSRFVSAGAAAVVSRRPSSFLFLPSLLSFDRETPTFCFFFFFFLYSPSLAPIEKLAAAPRFYLIRKREVKVTACTRDTRIYRVYIRATVGSLEAKRVWTKISRI